MTDIQLIDINKLTLLEDNPRTITKSQMDKLKKSIQEDPQFLHCRPILVNIDDKGEWIVYAGNQRVRAAIELEWATIPCVIEEDIPDHIMEKRMILDNKQMGAWNYDELVNFDTSLLLDAGFLEIELTGPEELSNNQEDKPTKKKKEKICPHCLMPL
jgi:ParB-like chromosome segregation protein Spo0J